MKNTLQESFNLAFPPSSGFTESQLLFYTGECDLKDVYFGAAGERGRLFVTDLNVARVCAPFVSLFTGGQELNAAALPLVFVRGGDVLCLLPAGEESKTIDNVLAICKAAVDANLSRGCLLVAHGDAVAWGISRAVHLAVNAGLCRSSFAQSTLKLLSSFGYETAALPKVLQGTPEAASLIVAAMHKDKKNSSSKVRVILQGGPQSTLTREVCDEELLAVLSEE